MVDHESQSTVHDELTPRQILTHASIDPERFYLVQIENHHQISYKEKSDEPIAMHQHMKFVSRREGHPIHYTVNDEPQTTLNHELTPRQILTNAGFSPDQYYLVQIIGHHQESYQGKLDVPIIMHQHMKFLAEYTGPTPVSAKEE
jgi:hypothetical protein